MPILRKQLAQRADVGGMRAHLFGVGRAFDFGWGEAREDGDDLSGCVQYGSTGPLMPLQVCERDIEDDRWRRRFNFRQCR